MELDRKKVIVREINHWRRSKLLPEQYCNFLLNLYGDDHDRSGSRPSVSAAAISSLPWKLWFGVSLSASLLLLAIIYFTSFPLLLQIGILVSFIFLCYGAGAKLRKTHRAASLIFLGCGSLFLLFGGLWMLRLHEVNHLLGPLAVTLASSLIWLAAGVAMRLPALQFCGMAGILMVYGWVVKQAAGELDWVQSQYVWVPLAALFLWLGWLFSGKSKSAGASFGLLGITLWFAPEWYLLVVDSTVGEGVLALALLIKLMLASVLLFLSRRTWATWVAL